MKAPGPENAVPPRCSPSTRAAPDGALSDRAGSIPAHPAAPRAPSGDTSRAARRPPFRDNPGIAIALDDVSFSYEQGRPVLDRVSLSAPQGRVTALVGPSGAGKSTILRLAARFWDAGDGTVTIGGADVRALPAAQIMDMTSMVFQDVYLFNCIFTRVKE